MRIVKKLLLLGVVMTTLAVISGASAQGVNPGVSKANIFLQNLSQTSENADITLQFTRGDGITVAPSSFEEQVIGLAPGGAKYLLYTRGWQDPEETTVADGWAGAVEVASSQPLAAIVNLFWDGNASAGTYPGVDTASHDVYLPNLLVRNGRLTMVYIQNTESTQCTDVDLHYYNRDGDPVMDDTGNTIPANTQITLDLSDENPDFSATAGTGSLHIHSDSCNLAAVATVHYPSGDRGSAAYRGFTGGETKVWFPSIFRRQSGTTWQLYNATIVQNLGSLDAPVTVHFIGKGSSATASVNDTIKAKASNGYNMITQGTASSNVWNTIQSLGTNWVGTIMVESTGSSPQPLAGVGFYFSINNVPDVMAFESIGDSTASDKLYSPAVYRKYLGNTSDQWSATLVQNLCDSPIETEIDFFDSAGAHAAGPYDVPIDANSSVGLNLHAGVDLPDQALTDLGTSYSGGMVVSVVDPSSDNDCVIGVTNIFYESKVAPGNSRERGAAYPLFPAP